MSVKYDVIVLGGGINGIASAKALAIAGNSVLVIEKKHIAAGASSHSSKLIHGGLRYLEHFEFKLVREALNDQKYLLETYPDLVKLRNFYLPIYKHSKRPVWMINLGLWLYSFFSKHDKKVMRVSKEEFLKEFDSIKENDLKEVFRYHDGKTDDEALTNQVAKEAKENGVVILEHSDVQRVDVKEESIIVQAGDTVFETNTLVNATGAWVDEINEKFNLPSSYTIEKLSGIHIVIDRMLIPEPLILETMSKRIFFIIPEAKRTIIGTTERREESNVDDIKVNDEDIVYLLTQSNRYLKSPLSKDDIKEVYIGTRPIIKSQKHPTQMSREYKLDLHYLGKNRLLHIYGGKLTTFPSLAKRVTDLLL